MTCGARSFFTPCFSAPPRPKRPAPSVEDETNSGSSWTPSVISLERLTASQVASSQPRGPRTPEGKGLYIYKGAASENSEIKGQEKKHKQLL